MHRTPIGEGFLTGLLLAFAITVAGGAEIFPPEGQTSDPRLGTACRVVSLVPSQTEMLFALGLGHLVVGVSDHCTFPPEVRDLPRVGARELSLERLAALQPTAIIDLDGMHQGYELIFRQLGWRYLNYHLASLEDVPVVAASLAADLHHPEAAIPFREQWTREMGFFDQAHERPPRVYVEIWDSPPQAAGPNSFLGEIIRLGGGENVVKEPHIAFPVIAPSEIVKADPEHIFLAYPTQDPGAVARRPGWSDITAIRHGRIHLLPPDLFVRPGPRCLRAARLFRKLLSHP